MLASLSTGEAICSLKLPESLDCHWAEFNPHPSYNSITGLNSYDWMAMRSNTRYAPLFSPDPSIDIITLEYKHQRTTLTRESRLLVMSVQGLLKLPCKQLTAETTTNNASDDTLIDTEYEWEDWSKSVARWLPWGMHSVSRRTSFGSRLLVYAWITPESAWEAHDIDTNQVYLILLDFNPRIRISDAENRYREALLDEIEKWTDHHSGLFCQTAALNFRVKFLKPFSNYRGALLHGDGFVARKVSMYRMRPYEITTSE